MQSAEIAEFVALRRDLHSHPELGLEEVRTSRIVAEQLARFGCRVETGIGGTGVVGTLVNGTSRRSIGLRADMDALPIHEATGLAYASRTPGKMHACGHDGHTTTLLAAAKQLAETRDFDGTVHLIFQPAEENKGGADLMVRDGLFRRFPCDAVYAMHNEPGAPFGRFHFRNGPIMAAVDEARITIQGRGGHGAYPQSTVDPIMAGASIIMALQTIVARNVAASEAAVVSVGAFHGGMASNVIPDTAEMILTIRSLTPAVRDLLEARIRALVAAQAEGYGASTRIDYLRSYPPTINHAAETAFARAVAVGLAGAAAVEDIAAAHMGSEDFAYMLEQRPGSYFFVGAGNEPERCGLHHPGFDFNDDLIPLVSGYWRRLVETALKVA